MGEVVDIKKTPPPSCKGCGHQDRTGPRHDIAQQMSVRKLAVKYGLSPSSVYRHILHAQRRSSRRTRPPKRREW